MPGGMGKNSSGAAGEIEPRNDPTSWTDVVRPSVTFTAGTGRSSAYANPTARTIMHDSIPNPVSRESRRGFTLQLQATKAALETIRLVNAAIQSIGDANREVNARATEVKSDSRTRVQFALTHPDGRAVAGTSCVSLIVLALPHLLGLRRYEPSERFQYNNRCGPLLPEWRTRPSLAILDPPQADSSLHRDRKFWFHSNLYRLCGA